MFVKMRLIAAGALALLLSIITPAQVLANTDCGDAGGGPIDIESMDASYDDVSGDITVTMTLCGGDVGDPSNRKTHYRIHFDYKDADGFLGPDTVPNSRCLTTSDDAIQLRDGKVKGPGDAVPDTTQIIFTINEADFDPPLMSGDTVHIWGHTNSKQVHDRYPNTQVSPTDSCPMPQAVSEVIVLDLVPPAPQCPAGCVAAIGCLEAVVVAPGHGIIGSSCDPVGPSVVLSYSGPDLHADQVGVLPIPSEDRGQCIVRVESQDIFFSFLSLEEVAACAVVAAQTAVNLGRICDISPP